MRVGHKDLCNGRSGRVNVPYVHSSSCSISRVFDPNEYSN